MKPPVDNTIKELLHSKLKSIEDFFKADVLCYFGVISDGFEHLFRKIIEELKKDSSFDCLVIILTTEGGSAIAVERYVDIIRKHYSKVYFVVPDYAYSAGTIFCMSGDKIYMDYSSVLGPIDPQVQNKDEQWVPALGYLDKINEMFEKSKSGTLSPAEYAIIRDIDLATLRSYEQAKELTVELLKKWLVEYKFKDWTKHNTNPDKKGRPVTKEEKIDRAKEIANKLNEHNKWKSHGRPLNLSILQKELKLQIEDYSNHDKLKVIIRDYYDLLRDYIGNKYKFYIHTKHFI